MNESEQPNEESLADRIASQFDEQPEAPAEEQPEQVEAQEESEAAPEFVEVELGGKTYQVPPELKDAVMAQSDYTKKTTEVAERARLLELRDQEYKLFESRRNFEETAKSDVATLQRLDFQLEQFKNLDATGLNSEQLWQLSRKIDELKGQREEALNALNGKYNAFQQEQLKLAQETKQKALEVASKSIPNWSDQTKTQIRDYAVSIGFDAQEVEAVTDPRVVKVLWQASQFAKAQQNKVTGKVTSQPAVKPGSSNPMPQAVKEQFALKKAMSKANTSASKAKVIEAELMKRFN